MALNLVRRTLWSLAILAALFLLGVCYAWTSLPDIDGIIKVTGAANPILVRRDDHGIPYIEANDEDDAAFALGFVHGQDRLWQMESQRSLGQDLKSRSETAYAELSDDARRRLAHYADGINQAIARHSGAPPPEFLLSGRRPQPWRPEDSLLVIEAAQPIIPYFVSVATPESRQLGISLPGTLQILPGHSDLAPAGQSGNPFSPYHDDLVAPWNDDRYLSSATTNRHRLSLIPESPK